MTTSNDEHLFQEMKTLLHRCGEDRCERAMEVAKLSLAPLKRVTIHLPSAKAQEWFTKLSLFPTGNFNVSLRCCGQRYLTSFDPFLQMMEEYYDSIPQHQQPFDPSSKIQNGASQFHSLYLDADTNDVANLILQREKCVALFERIVIEYRGFRNQRPFCFGRALVLSLQCHVIANPHNSRLRVLEVNDGLEEMDPQDQRDLIQIVEMLPSLESFKITIPYPFLLVTLIGRIGHWKLRRLGILCDFGKDTKTTDFRHLFGAVASSRYLKAFSFGCRTGRFLPQSVSEQLLHLALLPNSGLLEINVMGSRIRLRHFAALVPGDFDPKVAAKRQLRAFKFLKWDAISVDDNDDSDSDDSDSDDSDSYDRVIDNGDSDDSGSDDSDDSYSVHDYIQHQAQLASLLRLMSEQLPYLYSFGPTMWGLMTWRTFSDRDNASSLRNQVLVQAEKNRVGLSLFKGRALSSTVPVGLWAVVVHRTMTNNRDANHVPWNGVYHMVQELFQAGHSGRSQGNKKRRR